MEYLTPSEVRGRAAECRAAIDALLGTKALVGKPRARQWRFFRDGMERLLDAETPSEFDGVPPVRAAQLKFEVEDKLRRYYLRPGASTGFVFSLVHESELARYGVEEESGYPRLAGYCVLVRDLGAEGVGASASVTRVDLSAYLERVVTACADAEFGAYAALPEICLDEARRWFCADGPALREIANLVTRHRQRGWVISNPLNPSTKRVLSVKVKKIEGGEAVVATSEYWYLRWWDTKADTYVYPYRETNRQLYVLRKEPDDWRVFENLRPPPRSSAPHRWRQNREKGRQSCEGVPRKG